MEVDAVLALNSGSSSLKFSLFDVKSQELLLEGNFEALQEEKSFFWVKGRDRIFEESLYLASHAQAVQRLFRFFDSYEQTFSFVAIGYRIVHGGCDYFQPTLLDEKVLQDLKNLIPLAPLHLPHEIEVLTTMQSYFPKLPHVLCFDTSFFHDLPLHAQRFAIPDFAKVRRYGFHGISYEYIVSKLSSEKLIVAHLGSGCSLAAMKKGKPQNTTMGFSPAAGVVMATRPGDLDPGLMLYLLKEEKMSLEELQDLIYHKSGLQALSGSSNVKGLLGKKDLGIEIFCRSIAKAIASLMVDLEGLDDLVFTAGIGENAFSIRARVVQLLSYLGLKLEEKANEKNSGLISSQSSSAKIHVLKTDENRVIAFHTLKKIEKEGVFP